MSEVIIEAKMKAFIESPVSANFGLTIDVVAEKCKTYGRFASWLNSDTTKIKEVLTKVKSNGVSPAFFASYEKTEGYNSSWGWLNHTTPNGGYLNDSDTVSQWLVTQSTNTTDSPAWIDYANYNDFVPADVKQAGNTHFAGMKSGSIGKVVIAGTAAATWEVYYPNGLKASYNGIQDYGAPIGIMLSTIETWGGSLTGDPSTPPVDPVDYTSIITSAVTIVENGEKELSSSFTVDTDGLSDSIILGLKDIYKPPLVLRSQDYYSNKLFKLTKTFKNMLKINPNTGLNELIKAIIDEAITLINVDTTNNTSVVFDSMIAKIRAIPLPDGTVSPPTSSKIYFPIDVTQQGVNFWSPPHNDGLTDDMDYGTRVNGDFHAGFDVGAGGNTNLSLYATTAGTVRLVGDYSDGWGYRIEIDHTSDGYHSLYAHTVTGSNTVNVGDTVTAGQKIAIVGGSGGNYAIHLHYELSETGTFRPDAQLNTIDPKNYLKVTADNVTGLPNPTTA